MFLSLIRKETDDICTHGDLYIDGVWECHTLEDPIRPYPDKIAKRTAIWGDRTYTVTIDHSPKYGRDMLHVVNVPLFTGIRIHSGNDADDTEGCILVGKERDGHRITRSKEALILLYSKVEYALSRRELVYLVVANPILPMKPKDLSPSIA